MVLILAWNGKKIIFPLVSFARSSFNPSWKGKKIKTSFPRAAFQCVLILVWKERRLRGGIEDVANQFLAVLILVWKEIRG